MGMKYTRGDKIFTVTNYIVITIITFLTIYPFIYIISMSISDPLKAARGEVFLFPKGFSLTAYERVFMNNDIWMFFYNSFWYTIIGTVMMVIFTIAAAYPLSRSQFFARKFLNGFFLVPMFFFGGLIPFFQIVKATGLYGNRFALVIPYLIEIWNLMVCRTFFQSIPDELYEAAKIDGANEFQTMVKITMPLSKQIIAVMALFYGISNWNGWFAATLFLPDATMHPMQVYLKRVLVDAGSADAMMSYVNMGTESFLSLMQVKYAVALVASIPMILMYPFVQKYFEKGVMIGSLKG